MQDINPSVSPNIPEKQTIKQKNESSDNKTAIIVTSVILVIIALILGFYLGRNTKKNVDVKEVVKDITADWVLYDSDKYGFSFKHPESWEVVLRDNETGYELINSEDLDTKMVWRVNDKRSIDGKEDVDAIQISIPFDKKNYLIFSTSVANEEKEVFYNIPTTLVIN